MTKVISFEEIHANCTGIDVGSKAIFVSTDGQEVVNFSTFTADYYKCRRYLQEKDIRSVAMETTGVYWMSLYSILEEHGIKVCPVHPRETRQVKGRKSDVKASGLRIIKAGLSGERYLDRLADLCHERILERKCREVKNPSVDLTAR